LKPKSLPKEKEGAKFAANQNNIHCIMSSRFEIAGHVFTVEFHVYLFHLIDQLPYYDLPKHPHGNSGFAGLEMEDLEVQITKNDGRVLKYSNVKFPKRFGDVLDFYIYDTEAIFFPSYEYHTLSPKGVVLKTAVLQTMRHELVTTFIPELMLNVEFGDIKTIKWTNSRGYRYVLDFKEMEVSANPERSLPFLKSEQKPLIAHNSIDLRPLCLPIKNQGDLGTCGCCAVTTFLEMISGVRLSVLYMYYVTRVYVCNYMPHDDSGVELRDIMEALSRYGICRDETWPYDASKFLEEPSSKARDEALLFRPADFLALHNLEDIKDALRKETPVFVDVNFAPDAFGREPALTGKVGKPPTEEVEFCDHTVLIVGYNDESEELIFQNSWGTDWGEQGFGRVPYEYFNRGLFKNAFTWKGERPAIMYNRNRVIEL